MTHLALTDVTFAFPEADVDVSMSIESGNRLALVGPSGCGKTTVLRLIAGLLQPTGGSIKFDGIAVEQIPPHERGAVMVFQEHAMFPFRSVADNVGYGLKIAKTPKTERSRRVRQALADVELAGFEDRWPDELSGGQRQRVALARAIVVQPRILLLDEPLSSLDPDLRANVRDTICDVQERLGITTVIVTHDHDEAMAIAHTVAVMDAGRIDRVGAPAEVLIRSTGAV